MALKDIRPALRLFLLADPAIAAAVGTRMYPKILPQGQRSTSIVYNKISGIGHHHYQGTSGLGTPRYQIDVWAATPDDAANVANLIKERLDGYRGPMPNVGSPSDDVEVQGAFFESDREDYQADITMHRTSQDFIIWFEER